MEKEKKHKLPFLDVLLDTVAIRALLPRCSTKIPTLVFSLNYYSFVPFSFLLGLVRTLVDRTFKVNITWTGFHLAINDLTKTLRRNLFPSSVIENVVKSFFNNYFTLNSSQSVARKNNCFVFYTTVHRSGFVHHNTTQN